MRIIWLGKPEGSGELRVTRFIGKVLSVLRRVIPEDQEDEGLLVVCRWDELTEGWTVEEVFEELSGRLVWEKGSGNGRREGR